MRDPLFTRPPSTHPRSTVLSRTACERRRALAASPPLGLRARGKFLLPNVVEELFARRLTRKVT